MPTDNRGKYAELLRARGTPLRIDARATILHIRWLHDVCGMSYQHIGDEAAVSKQHVGWLARLETGRIDRRTAARIALVKPSTPVGTGPVKEWGGARVNLTGTVRRLNALCFDGWTVDHLAVLYGGDKTTLNYLLLGKRNTAMGTTYHKVKELYRNLDGTDPLSAGINPLMQKRAIRAAKVRGGAPRICWDDDSIDNPDNIAQWTGECGTTAGYRIHKHEGAQFWKWTTRDRSKGIWVVGCEPCRKANSDAKHSR
jgi:hypothetical protein